MPHLQNTRKNKPNLKGALRNENRLTAYAKKHPDLCRLTDDTEDVGLSFEVVKGRFCFRLTEPYSDERRAEASKCAKKQNNRLRNHKLPPERSD